MSKRARQLLQDFLVVVIGVFVALAAESWWSEREHRQFEREIREDMVAEFESNIQILDDDLAKNAEARPRFAVLSGLSDDELLAVPDSVLSEKLDNYVLWAGFDPDMGSVQALVESGNLGAVGDRELRLRLARWAGFLNECHRKVIQAVEYQHHELATFSAQAGSDLRWTETERRQVRALLSNMLVLFDTSVRCQRKSREAALDVLEYLEETN